MNSRERVLAAINHKETDKLPVDLGASSVTGISAIAYNKLSGYLGFNKIARIFDVVQQLAMIDDEIIDLFGVDAVDVNRLFTQEDKDWYEVELGDGSKGEYPKWFRPAKSDDGSFYTLDAEGRQLSKMTKGGSCFDQTFFPWENAYPENFSNITDAFKSINWIIHSQTNNININDDELRLRISDLRENSDKAIIMSGGVKMLELGFFLRRMDNLLMDLLADQDNLSLMLDKLMEINLAGLEKKCRAVGDLVDVIRMGDDLGMTSGPFMDPDTFKKLFKPRYKILCDYIKQNSNMKIFLHSCGSIRQYIPDLIEVGFDIINPVQTNCYGMDAKELKNEFGRDITFWGGGVDTASVLPTASTDDIRKDVLNRCEILSKGGGFIFAPIHNILPEVAPENIEAVYLAVKEFNGE